MGKKNASGMDVNAVRRTRPEAGKGLADPTASPTIGKACHGLVIGTPGAGKTAGVALLSLCGPLAAINAAAGMGRPQGRGQKQSHKRAE